MMLVDGQPQGRVDALDRGLLYGDGLFETIRFVDGMAPLWPRHMQRLAESCERLRLPAPDAGLLWREAQSTVQGLADAVLRITLTRGVGARGYAMPGAPHVTRIVAAFAMPEVATAAYRDGVRLHLCETRLAEQPLLAGIKHLNRLEQVLARAEWNDPAIAEGVVCDLHGHAISATAANLFAVIDGVPVTPRVNRCGVAGVLRAELLAVMPQAQVRDLLLTECLAAGELFLSSSVRGILPVQAVGDRVFTPGPVARAMQVHWRGLGFTREQA
ncbi:aminodeoxychorismate lyase [Rhodanobacter sp. DHG33]|uniref:aminodeoxychorismate lyase n=1 Tax=Rhodanobacter sp. DHG33 TaxID=2775921 RepID=UPI0017854145|nr:aminodeoxychorismate lyase [Rhodanobacter sp. DHG33]MBD8898226.1 aminodeoxychorismate lyase [Rhodanobacter sp. DHG33]